MQKSDKNIVISNKPVDEYQILYKTGLGIPSRTKSTAHSEIALRGSNLKKFYKTGGNFFKSTKLTVLNDLNVNVRKGQIYGLLGPSGCGKTTLLKCLLGMIKIDSGEIHIDDELKRNGENNQFRLDLNKLGFMPQESTLYNELTIKETFYYFGKLYSLEDKTIKIREEFLIDLLDLPSRNLFVGFLSGGQLRRTSLAVSLLNKPSILVLDEPTVGMDPILRKKIWNYFVNLSNNEQTTIIITTHYIEEARKADCLGFMRNGKIIEENSPEYFVNKYKQNILEEIFYTICSKCPSEKSEEEYLNNSKMNKLNENYDNEKNLNGNSLLLNEQIVNNNRELYEIQEEYSKENTENFEIKNPEVTTKPTKKSKTQPLAHNNFAGFSLNRILANIYKDLIKCKRNRKLMIVQLVVPLIQITLFCLCIGRPPRNVSVGFVDNEPDHNILKFGKNFINEIDNQTIAKKNFKTLQEGMKELRTGNIWSLIEIDSNFTAALLDAYIKKKMPANGFSAAIHVYSDNTNHQISYAIRNSVLRAIRSLIERFMFEPVYNTLDDEDRDYENDNESNQNSSTNEIELLIENIQKNSLKDKDTNKNNKYPIVFEDSVYGENEPVFTHFMAPGIALSVIFFMSVAATASNFVLERRLGLIGRSYLIGVRTIEILISQLIVFSLIMLIQVIMVLCLLFGVFRLPLRGSLILLVIMTFSQGFCGLCYGLFLASILYDEETVIQATLASFYPMLLMSGIIWPIEAQPNWLNHISKFLPLTYASESFRAILEKDWNLTNFYVFRGFLATYLWTIFFSICFLVMFSRKYT